MGTQFAFGRIVTDGLVLALDAADRNSYVSGSLIWNDVSGNRYSGSLINGPAFNANNLGYISFDGVNDYVLTSYTQPAQDATTTSFTWDIWVYPTLGNVNVIVGFRGSILDFNKLTPIAWEYYPETLTASMTLNVWQNICLIKNGNSIYYYKNLTLVNSRTITITKPTYPFYVGGDPALGEYSTSLIASVRVYNRALSISEMRQNYDFQKVRYGLK